MKATEENVFLACDAFYAKHKKDPTGDDLLAICGGGKKEVLALRDKWRALQYLKSNCLDVPTEWVAFLAKFYREISSEIDLLKASRLEEINASIIKIQGRLTETLVEKTDLEGRLTKCLQDLEHERVNGTELSKSIGAAELRIEQLTLKAQQQNVEMSQKDLQLKLLQDQITSIKEDHLRELANQKQQYEASIAEKNDLLVSAQQSITELKDEVNRVSKELLKAETLHESGVREATRLTLELSEARDRERRAVIQLRELETKYNTEQQKAGQIPALNKTIGELKEILMNKEKNSNFEMLEHFKSLNESVMQLSKIVTPGSTEGRKKDD